MAAQADIELEVQALAFPVEAPHLVILTAARCPVDIVLAARLECLQVDIEALAFLVEILQIAILMAGRCLSHNRKVNLEEYLPLAKQVTDRLPDDIAKEIR